MKRYHPTYTSSYDPMYEGDEGEYVTYDDAIALARRVAEIAWIESGYASSEYYKGQKPEIFTVDAIITEASRDD